LGSCEFGHSARISARKRLIKVILVGLFIINIWGDSDFCERSRNNYSDGVFSVVLGGLVGFLTGEYSKA
jgi:hypothetical protein